MYFPYIRCIICTVIILRLCIIIIFICIMLFRDDEWVVYIIHIYIYIISYRLYFTYVYIRIIAFRLHILYHKVIRNTPYNIIHTRIGHSLFSGLLSSYRLLLLFKLSYSCLTSFLLTNGAVFFITQLFISSYHRRMLFIS